MATPVKLPRMGANMEEGTIIQWLKKVGEPIKKGEPLLEIATDKVNAEVDAPADGVLLEIRAEEGAVIPVGQVIGLIGAPEEAPAAASAPAPASTPPAGPEAAPAAAPSAPPGRVRASPAARKLAQDLGVDIAQVRGTGPLGRVTRQDVLRASGELRQAAPPPPPATPPAPAPARPAAASVQSRIRRLTAERMMASLHTTAQLTLTMSADITRADELRRELQGSVGEGTPVTWTALLLKAVALALREVPDMLARWDDAQGVVPLDEVNLGMAVATPSGLLVPVLRQADKLSLLAIARWVNDAAQRARDGRLAVEELEGGTFSLTNLGQYPVEYFTPILNPPESGILGVGRAKKQPVVTEDDQVAVRLILPLSLTWDHRIVDGVPAAQFCACVKDLLEHPLRLLAS